MCVCRGGRTDRQTNRQTYRQTTDRQSNRLMIEIIYNYRTLINIVKQTFTMIHHIQIDKLLR